MQRTVSLCGSNSLTMCSEEERKDVLYMAEKEARFTWTLTVESVILSIRHMDVHMRGSDVVYGVCVLYVDIHR